jgi:hypothetical protein
VAREPLVLIHRIDKDLIASRSAQRLQPLPHGPPWFSAGVRGFIAQTLYEVEAVVPPRPVQLV